MAFTVVERWLLLEVRLYNIVIQLELLVDFWLKSKCSLVDGN